MLFRSRTSLGAYYAYQSAGAELGYTPYELKDFTKETASTEFLGTLFSKTLDQSVTKDEIDFYTLADNRYTRYHVLLMYYIY